MAFLFPVMMIMMNFTNIAIIWFGGIRIDQGSMQVGNLMAFLQYASMILIALIMLAMTFVMIPRAQASADRINEVLLTVPSITDPKEPQKDSGLRGYVEFQDVTFRYAGAEKPVLENITFKAKPGETTAIIGSTGAGKNDDSSIDPEIFDIEKGSVLVNGTDVRKMAQKELRAKIGYVPQKLQYSAGRSRTISDLAKKMQQMKKFWKHLKRHRLPSLWKARKMELNLISSRPEPTFQAARNSGFPSPGHWSENRKLFI